MKEGHKKYTKRNYQKVRKLEMHPLEDSNFRNEVLNTLRRLIDLYKVTELVTKPGSGPEAIASEKWNLNFL